MGLIDERPIKYTEVVKASTIIFITSYYSFQTASTATLTCVFDRFGNFLAQSNVTFIISLFQGFY